jgi:DNA-binding HxlR family transcriptional regulator
LSERIGQPPRSTAYRQLGTLVDIGVLSSGGRAEKRRDHYFALTQSGRELRVVADVLDSWLTASPEGPAPVDTTPARSAVKALDAAWSSGIIRALSVRHLTLTELDRLIAELSYPQLERRLAALRRAGQIETCTRVRAGPGTPYTATEWLRQALAPVISAIQWERSNLPTGTAAITRRDFETIFLLALPAVTLPPGAGGSCRLAVEMEGERGPVRGGAMVEVDRGRVVSCSTRLSGSRSSASAPPGAWLRAIAKGNLREFDISDRTGLTAALLEGLHGFLFPRRGSLHS